ncbi:gliding motility lipoprotein GldH [Flavobacterium saccharophilum]|uniref:Protein involved in gliding motility GldH n=1 Tax=Flavobacterium saccharophilum TaxID=29534 RepID=A0A1M6ZPX6_9FLAO|nr:gliding motility lipoprotein GldH [Flavobacterium saccharophilum]SHL32496.1 protein involved in gliding motility GldH [Flavobacterium saccharophilum]
MRIKNSGILLLAAILLFSCDKKRVFDEYKSVGSAWHKDSVVTFDLPVLDSTKKYNLFVNLRDNNNYPFNNLFLIVSLEMPNGFTKVDTLEYQMANPDGTLLGNGFTDIKESKLFYKEDVKFRGKYKVHIKQAVRQSGKIPGVEELEGVTDVGFRIEQKD